MKLIKLSSYIFKIHLLFFVQWSLSMNQEETEAIQKLRPLVQNILTQKYMHEDVFLLPFLKVADLDVDKASEKIQTSMTWRIQNNIDAIQDEENSQDRAFPYTIGIDKNGRPVMFFRAGAINLKKAVISGKLNLSFRSSLKLAEKMAAKVRALNVTQVVGILDLNGFNYRQHACQDCIQFGQAIGQAVDPNYPGLAVAVFFINTPRLFEVVLSVIKVILSEASKKVLHVYGFDKAEWTHALLQWISADELSALLGTDVIIPNPNKIRHSHHNLHSDNTLPISSNDHQKVDSATSSTKMNLLNSHLSLITFLYAFFYLNF